MHKTDKLLIPAFVFIAFLFFYGTGCETAFDPLQENDQYKFSMYGVLDLHADTQWIRVTPIQDTLLSRSTEPIDAQVTLTRERTNETVVLEDSLFLYSSFAYARNYWTPERLHPEEEYTVQARGQDNQYSSVLVTMPASLPLPVVEYTFVEEKGMVYGEGVENLVVAETNYLIQVIAFGRPSPPFTVVFSHLSDAFVEPNGDYRFPVDFWPRIREIVAPSDSVIILEREVVVASSRKDWPDLSGLDKQEIFIPEGDSNVENGTGMIAGIASRKMPLESCFDEEGKLTACPELK
ncbi:MAG: hypothetical protein WEA56_15915 [Balneolaceae bacterium]